MITIAEFIQRHNISMTSRDAPENPNMMDKGKEMFNYYCTLRMEERELNVYYSMGFAHVEILYRMGKHPLTSEQLVKHGIKGFLAYDPKYKDVVVREWGGRGVLLKQFNNGSLPTYTWRAKQPEVEDVLDCLAGDAQSIDNARSFEDWASNYGYDSDSRSAERSYQATLEASKNLRVWLGAERYRELLKEVERL